MARTMGLLKNGTIIVEKLFKEGAIKLKPSASESKRALVLVGITK
jgi:hypothetical protein